MHENMLRRIASLLVVLCFLPLFAVADETEPEETAQSQQAFALDYTLYNVGDTFTMGTCEQDGNKNNGYEPIEWIVLDKFEDRIFVISKYCLDSDSYYNPAGIKYKYTTYEACDVRAWLNSDFYTQAFTDAERAMIALTHNKNDDNPDYGVDGGNDTEDYVFLISHDECAHYFPTQSSRKAAPTNFCKKRGAETIGKWCYWWLRTPGKFRCNAEYVFNSGRIYTYGSDVGHDMVALRPAMVIYLNDQARSNDSGNEVWQNPNA